MIVVSVPLLSMDQRVTKACQDDQVSGASIMKYNVHHTDACDL